MSTYTRWYRDGSVALTKGSTTVVGTNTYWLTADLHPGDIFKVDGVDYEILSIADDTHLTLAGNYTGTTENNKAYAIVRNFTATTQARMAAQTAELLGDFAKYIDNDMQSIHGKSAYQIACEKGFAGTESEWVASLNAYGVAKSEGYTGSLSEWLASLKGDSAYAVAVQNGFNGSEEAWLESLKADNEWATLDARTSGMTIDSAGLHNCLYRGKNLGEFTADHLATIKSGKFTDMWIGDYFRYQVTQDGNAKWVEDVICQFGVDAPINNKTNAIYLMRRTPLVHCNDYQAIYNRPASGTEGEDDYDPGTLNKLYMESNWYTVVRPKFIEEIEGIYGAANLATMYFKVPTSMNGTVPTSWGNAHGKANLPSIKHFGLPYWNMTNSTVSAWNHWGCAYRKFPLVHLQPDALPHYVVCAESVFWNGNSGRMSVLGLASGGNAKGDYVDYLNSITANGSGGSLCPIFIVC